MRNRLPKLRSPPAAKPSWEDDDRLRRIAAGLLASLGYQVREAGGAREALDLLNEDEAVDLLSGDVVMSGCMLGSELATAVRVLRPNAKVLLTTGYLEVFVRDGVGHLDNVGLTGKPYRNPELAAKIRELLDRPD
jgi:CheY-like chemotaxis protein